MSTFKARLERLERTAKAAAVCPVCKGEGYPSIVMDIEGELPKPPGGCRRCGKSRPGRRIVLCLPPEARA